MKTAKLHVEISLESVSEPIVIEDALSVYVKQGMVCVSYFNAEGSCLTDKYPMDHVFRVRHTYTGKSCPKCNDEHTLKV
jgi:hypothetical protein